MTNQCWHIESVIFERADVEPSVTHVLGERTAGCAHTGRRDARTLEIRVRMSRVWDTQSLCTSLYVRDVVKGTLRFSDFHCAMCTLAKFVTHCIFGSGHSLCAMHTLKKARHTFQNRKSRIKWMGDRLWRRAVAVSAICFFHVFTVRISMDQNLGHPARKKQKCWQGKGWCWKVPPVFLVSIF